MTPVEIYMNILYLFGGKFNLRALSNDLVEMWHVVFLKSFIGPLEMFISNHSNALPTDIIIINILVLSVANSEI